MRASAPDLQKPASADRGPGAPMSGTGFSRKGLLGALVPVALLLGLFVVDLPLCPSKNVLGLPCPGCGLTRATAALLTGDLEVALAFHPLFPLIVPMVAWAVLRTVLVSAGLLRAESFDPLARVPRWMWLVFGVIVVGVWVLRLAGHLGGHPDEVDLQGGLLGTAISAFTR